MVSSRRGSGLRPADRLGRDAAAAGVALLVDRLVADPPDRFHPVAWFGSLMARLERSTYRDDRWVGTLHAGAGVLVAGLAAQAVARLASRRLHAPAAATLALAVVALGGGGLDRAARRIEAALDRGDIDRARLLLPWLVGRDPRQLDEAEISRAVVESVAENSVDAVVAPCFWAVVGGPAGLAVHRAVNTLDAMVGHRSVRYERFGWASARLDDAFNYVPARLTAGLVAAVRPARARDVWNVVRRDGRAHPSPNAGVAEAAFAAALGLRLGGTNRYRDRVEHRPALGAGLPPGPHDIRRARHLARDAGAVLAAALVAPAAIGRLRKQRGARPTGHHHELERTMP